MDRENKARERIVEVGDSLYRRGLSPGSSGNISARLDDGWLVTPTNSCLGALDPAKLAKLDCKRPASVPAIYRAKNNFCTWRCTRSGLRATQSSIYTALILLRSPALDGLNSTSCIPPITPYFVMRVGKLPLIPYFRPGDKALAHEIARNAAGHAAILLANHGPVVSGKDLDSALCC